MDKEIEITPRSPLVTISEILLDPKSRSDVRECRPVTDLRIQALCVNKMIIFSKISKPKEIVVKMLVS